MRMEVLDQRMVKNFYDPDDEDTKVDPARKAACNKAVEAHNLAETKLTKIVKKMFALFVSSRQKSSPCLQQNCWYQGGYHAVD